MVVRSKHSYVTITKHSVRLKFRTKRRQKIRNNIIKIQRDKKKILQR